MFILNDTNYSDGKATFYDNAGYAVNGGTLRIYRGDTLVSSHSVDASGSASFSIDSGVFYRFEIVSSSGELVSVLDPVLYEALSGEDPGSHGEDYGDRINELERKLDSEASTRASADNSLKEGVNDVRDSVDQLSIFLSEERSARESADAAHEGRHDNPHEVTAHQVGAYTKQETDAADAEIITSLEDETAARRINDELLAQQIEDVAVQTDWNEDNSQSLAFLKNRPSAISNLEIEALFI